MTEYNGAATASVMASPGTAGSVTVSLHPLVILNISEHWTRIRAQEGKLQVIGALIGQHKGRHLEIMNSFELVYSEIEGMTVIDKDYYKTKEEQFKQVFQDMDFLGWYTTGDMPTPMDIHIQRQICEINESPVLLKLNPLVRTAELPVAVFESVIDLLYGVTTMLFVQLPYTLATEEAERIGVDHVARVQSADDSLETSLVAEHLQSQHSAIKMLQSRVKLILDYIKAVEKGEVPVSEDALRLAYSLCRRLPVMKPQRFQTEFFEQCNDVNLITYLGMITKGCEEAHQYILRFNLLHEKHIASRRMRGLFY